MQIIIWILLATLINSLLGLIGIFSLLINKKLLGAVLKYLIAFSAGALLGGAFFHLLPESLEHLLPINVFGYALIGFVLFLLVEGYFHWHLCEKCEAHPFTYLMLIGDGIHNFIDGLVIAATFIISIPLGIITTLMIMAHEVPQEVGLFGVLVYGGHKKRKSLIYSFLAQSTSILGGIIGFLISAKAVVFSHFLIPFAAGGFIYIAASDLVPEMHKMYKGEFRKSISIISFFAIGVLLLLAIKMSFGY
jgi:zinc and cadmium transporter